MVREMKFFDLYKSFDEFYNTMLRGNEVEFIYNEKHFYILPHFDENEKVTGVCLGEAYTDDEKIYFSSGELYNAPIEGTTLNKILQEIDVKFNAI